ncbi:beta-ribofuranosylaminobenzene 5'-phosphate synthase family protein [Phyllobacterium myrsinacearum]|uniref:Beta-RFAP synthase n=1 Tax=Phyllobacterium myrsinacearum TaxID=28101 RepID=A0A839ERG6_9HYPH|nr:beta-ribofuranosylaminobenzene 5'-phosphate synthase family protein [Phyllobacterium myrsinacearum]MBA8881402.1 beta-RFAP synthase [Phyllobacterium myrsinacearum]
MSESVTIEVPARIHLGFLDIPRNVPESGQDRFGSIGLPIQDIATVLTISRAAKAQVEGDEQKLVAQHVTTFSRYLGITAQHKVVVHRTIPRHIGLGSGTQIALAVAAALRSLHALPLDIVNDASMLGRGTRSGIGIAAFEDGGVIVDAGKGPNSAAPTIVSRIPFPEEWRIILVFDTSTQGIHGDAEIKAFKALPPFPLTTSAAISRHVLMGVMPGLIEKNVDLFGRAITAIQTEIGNYFAPAQGGIFTSKHVEATIRQLARAGAVGIGQSSWGPTGFAFAPSQTEAERIVNVIDKNIYGSAIQIVAGRNTGADITHTALNLARAFTMGAVIKKERIP